MSDHSDEELLKLLRNKQQTYHGFRLLVRKYQERIYYFVRRIVINHEDADYVVQNIFIKIWNNLDSFREDSRLFTWIYRIAVNESFSFLKQKRLKNMVSLDSFEASAIRSLNDDNYFNGSDIEKKLQLAILRLPEKQKMVFNMRYYEDLSYEEMSDILGTSVGALKASYHFATKKISDFVLAD